MPVSLLKLQLCCRDICFCVVCLFDYFMTLSAIDLQFYFLRRCLMKFKKRGIVNFWLFTTVRIQFLYLLVSFLFSTQSDTCPLFRI